MKFSVWIHELSVREQTAMANAWRPLNGC